MLTNESDMVKLALVNNDTVYLTQKIKDSWEQAKQVLIRDYENYRDPEKLNSLIESYFSENNFHTKEESSEFKNTVVSLLSKKMKHKNTKEFEDSIYLFENSIVECYVHSLQYQSEGGKK